MQGLIEEKNAQLAANEVFDDYRIVFEQYVALINATQNGIEALKRSIFLLWFEDAEPPFLSGLHGLSEDARLTAFNWLERLLDSDQIDSEFTWMLQYYYAITDWVFNARYNASPELRKLLADNHESWTQEAKAENFIDRGRMSDY